MTGCLATWDPEGDPGGIETRSVLQVLHYILQSLITVSEVPATKIWCGEIR